MNGAVKLKLGKKMSNIELKYLRGTVLHMIETLYTVLLNMYMLHYKCVSYSWTLGQL